MAGHPGSRWWNPGASAGLGLCVCEGETVSGSELTTLSIDRECIDF